MQNSASVRGFLGEADPGVRMESDSRLFPEPGSWHCVKVGLPLPSSATGMHNIASLCPVTQSE